MEALVLAFELTDLGVMQMLASSISLTCNKTTEVTPLISYRKEQSAQLWLSIEKYLQEQVASTERRIDNNLSLAVAAQIAKIDEINLHFKDLVKNTCRNDLPTARTS